MCVLIRSHLGFDKRMTMICALPSTSLCDIQQIFESQLTLPKSPNLALCYQGKRLINPQLTLVESGVKGNLSLLSYQPAGNLLLGGSRVTPENDNLVDARIGRIDGDNDSSSRGLLANGAG